ncbi:MAG: lysophospholipid acyltransferase family protein [Candidatus Omnitrophota bacterium]|nr:lysophospholipid acyltransferase family protein [Candidatus Omnitrophota bacterium]
MLYIVYKIVFFLTNTLPLRCSYAIASAVARIFYICSTRDRRELKENLRVVMGDGTDGRTLGKCAFRVFRNFGKYMVDFFRCSELTEAYIKEKINVSGLEHLDECVSEGRGTVLVALHLGNWELGGAFIGRSGYPISAIVLDHADKRVNAFFVRQRAVNGLKSIPIGAQIRECFKAIKRNEMVAVVGDKDYTSNGIPVTFFGKKAVIPRGPAVLALRTGAPMVFCGVIRNSDDTYSISFEEPIRQVPTGDHKKDEEELIGKYLRVFERYIRRYPDQWYVFRRIWPQEKTIQ